MPLQQNNPSILVRLRMAFKTIVSRCRALLALLLWAPLLSIACNREQPKPAVLAPVAHATRPPALQANSQSAAESDQQLANRIDVLTATEGNKTQFAPDIKPQAIRDLRKMASYVAIDSPGMVKAENASFLSENEYVLGITEGEESRAYPVRCLTFHHVINDHIGKSEKGGVPVTITYFVVCGTGICYDPVVNGKTLQFDFYGLYNGMSILCERDTQGVFLPAEGRIVSGPLTGTNLKSLPALDTTWGRWKRLHPNTLVMSPETLYKGFYSAEEPPVQRGASEFPMPMFEHTMTRRDMRLKQFDTVLAVTLASEGQKAAAPLHRAYPLTTLARIGDVANDRLGGAPVGVLMDPKTLTAIALLRQLGSKTLTFEARKQADGSVAFYDKETGTRWNVEGIGEEGPLAGKALPRLNNHLSQWYGWAASFPDTSIYGRTDPPQPVEVTE